MFALTQEQASILEAVKSGDPLIKINAFAGTGKTTTLLAIANELRGRTILYLAFNKSIQLEAKSKFPHNTLVKTTHSIAYGRVVFKGGYNKPRNDYKPREVAEMFFCDMEVAKLTLLIFNNYCNSASRNISIDNVNEATTKTFQAKKYAKELFDRMMNKEIEITHSFYLKAFQIGLLDKTINPRPYDLIMLDEAQDTNDVTLSIFYNLPARQKIIVGDRHQQIYSFRGSVNAMKKVKASIYYLTQSFRFGKSIADNATYFLNIFKGEKKTLKGTERDVVIRDKAYISRTNAMLIGEIARLIDDEKFFKTVREPYAIFSLCLNILKLKDKEELDSAYKYLEYYYNDFKCDEDETNLLTFLKEKAKDVDDVELHTASKIVIEYGNRIKHFYAVAKENYNSHKECDLFLTTAHTSKGLEWDEVELLSDFDITKAVAKYYAELGYSSDDDMDYLEDFSNIVVKGTAIEQELIDEFNLYYVAITRAKVKVVDNTELYDKLVDRDRDAINNEIKTKIKELIIDKE